MAEAKAEYTATVQEKERRAKAYKVRLGSMDKDDYELAKEVLKGIQAEGLDAFPEEAIRKAEILAPDYIAALRREQVVNNPDYSELVKNGAYPKYHPTAKRKELYAEFATATGDKAEWSVSRPFAALTEKEMDALMEGVRQLKVDGLGRLTKPQRLLLLKAGGLDYFASQIEK